MKTFKRHRDYGFFDQDLRLSKLSKLGDPLERLKAGIDFELFRGVLETDLIKEAKGKGGRRPYDYVMMFKILILQRYYNLSDDQTEYQICDRFSFMRFLDLTIADDVPDSKTVWLFREALTDLDLVEKLFKLFINELEKLNLIINEGKIVDASFVEVPRQRNSRDENTIIKNGGAEKDALWKDTPNKQAQKDTDALWTKKNKVNYFGYKNHIKTDSKSKIVIDYKVTDASVHDSQVINDLLKETDRKEPFYADSAYTGPKQEAVIADKEMINLVCEKGYKNKPLNEEQKAKNREKSRVRARVEHVFGFMEMSMNGMYLQVIGLKRINAMVGLVNLTYNMFRKLQISCPR